MTGAPSIDPNRMIRACNARHSEIIAACRLGYEEACRADEPWLFRAIKRATLAGNIGFLADYLETLAWLLEQDEIDESDVASVAARCAALRSMAERALNAAESLAREEWAQAAQGEP